MLGAQYGMWVLGWLSGLNLARANDRGDVLRQTDAIAALSWIDLHCRNNPLDSVMATVADLDKELSRRNGHQ